MLPVVLPEQIFAVVVTVGRPDDDVNVLAVRRVRIGRKVPQVGGPLMIELDS